MLDPLGLPTGTVTFLFSVIVGSTKLQQRTGRNYAGVLGDHQSLLRQAWMDHGGFEIDTAGDGFFVAFASAPAAVAAAAQATASLAAHTWPEGEALRVRIGLHTGTPQLVGSRYIGLDVVRAARIAACGHGGQVLLSQTTRDLITHELPAGAALRDLGAHQLKDLQHAEHIYQVIPPNLPANFPPLKTLDEHPHNLPVQPTPLLGREEALAAICKLLCRGNVRLVTLTGAGGIGKTRLAIQVAAELLEDFPDGVWFVRLSRLSDPTLVMPTTAQTLGLKDAGGQPITESLRAHLRTMCLLLVLDNFEQVAEAASDVARLLEFSPGLNLLVTSRVPLHLRGEHEYPLAPLSLPDPNQIPPPEHLSRYAAAVLFVERALEARPDFAVTATNAPAIAEICTRLDGLPLAIELTAVRVKVLSPEALLVRFSSQLKLLTGGARDLEERQQTMRATIAWSENLLSPEERMLFRRLAVFVGGATLEAVEAVCALPETSEPLRLDILDGLGALVDQSLVLQHEEAGQARFTMLHVIREYALEQLEASGEADSLSRAHAAYFVALAQHAEPELTGAHQRIWLERLASDYENLRAALTHLASTAESADQGLKLAGALAIFWYVRGLYGEGLHWLQRMLDAHKDETTSPPVAAVWGAGLLQLLAGDAGRASALLEHSLALARELDDRAWMSRTLDVLGLLAFFGNDLMLARQRLEESVELARQANDRWSLADALGTLGSIYPLQGAFDLAEQVEVEALAIARSRDDLQGMRMAQFGLALTAARRGDLVAAQHLGEDGLAVSRAIGDRWFAAYFLWILANAATASGDIARGRVMADESLSFAREVQGPLLIVCALEASAAVAHAEGDDASAESQLVEAEMIGRDGPVPGSYLATALRAHGELLLARDDLMRARQLFDESFAIARQVGDAWSIARALSSLALVAWRQNDVERAQVLIGEAIDIATQIGDRLGLAESRDRAAAMSTRVAKGAE